MNCQDIARIIDSGAFTALLDSDRRKAEEHALSCRHCARLWLPHSRLAASPVPAMPPDLSRHCLALVTAAARNPATNRAPRMVVVVTSLIALAAAASMVGVGLSSKLAPRQDEPLASIIVPPDSPVPGASGDPSGAAGQALSTLAKAKAASSSGDLPLFPPPYDAQQVAGARTQMALEKFTELHPEVTQVPPAGSWYDGTILVRDDGNVLEHSIRTISAEALRSSDEPERGLPNDSREPLGTYFPKGFQLPSGRALAANLSLRSVVVRNDYDLARSSLRVEQIIQKQRARLMAPPTESGGSHVTLLLSSSGAIRREVAGHMDRNALQEQEEWSTTTRAGAMAAALGVSKDEIGLMGSVTVVDEGTNRGVVVDYAWQRLPGESAPQYRQAGWDRFGQGDVDSAAALAVVERAMPGAFIGVEAQSAIGIPAILLTEKGEFMRTGRAVSSDVRNFGPEKVFPGVSIAMFRMLVLTNAKGTTSSVYFMWQGSPPPTGRRAPASTN